MRFKYLVLDNMGYFGNNDAFLLFPELVGHDEMVRKLDAKGHVVAAGFCIIDKEGVQCGGKSTSLRVESRGEVDARMMSKMGDA